MPWIILILFNGVIIRMTEMPVVFIGHGLAINAALTNDFSRALQALRTRLPTPIAIAVISAHWSTPEIRITGAQHPRQIFDSIEFQEELHEISYEPPGDPQLAAHIQELFNAANFDASIDQTRGIDTSVWGILVHLFPEAQIPVVEISLSYHIDTTKIIPAARSISRLRDEGVLIIGSGGLVHNPYEMSRNIDTKPPQWALECDKQIAELIETGSSEVLSEYTLQNLGRSKAIPTPEHILPAIAILALKKHEDRVDFFYNAFQNSTISLRSFILERSAQ